MWSTITGVAGILSIVLVADCVRLSGLDEAELDFAERLLRVSEQIERDPALKADWDQRVLAAEEHQRTRDIEIPPTEFTCNLDFFQGPTWPDSVHKLKPSDINVLAAFGDSITAGNGLGARHLIEVAIENRGESWLIGGDRSIEEGVVTLANILKKFNPGLKGYSLCAAQRQHERRSWFNIARPGAQNDDMLEEAELLHERMLADSRVNYTHDWKMISMFVGGNDLCVACHNGRNTPALFYYEFERALVYLKANMPRTIINLISMFDVTPLQNMSRGIVCDLMQWGFCDCARNWTTLPMMREYQLEYHKVFLNLSADPRFQADDFAIVVQPHMRDIVPPVDPSTGNIVKDILSPDCFHPQRISHQGFAAWLWNTLLIPVGQKPLSWPSDVASIDLSCPTEENPYIFTNFNSDLNRAV
jgi:phospholipase B1